MFSTLVQQNLFAPRIPKQKEQILPPLVKPTLVKKTPRLSVENIEKLDDDSFLAYIDERAQHNKNIFSNELKQLNQLLLKRALQRESEAIKIINQTLESIDKLKPHIKYGYIMRYLLKQMIDAESQEEFRLHFRTFNQILKEFSKKANILIDTQFYDALTQLSDVRFVFLNNIDEHEVKKFKTLGKIAGDAMGSFPLEHIIYSAFKWGKKAITMLTDHIFSPPSLIPTIPVRKRISNFVSNHAGKIFVASTLLAMLCVAAPVIVPLITPIVTTALVAKMVSGFAIGSLLCAGGSAISLWKREKQRNARIETRLNETEQEIKNIFDLDTVKPSQLKARNLAWLIKQMYPGTGIPAKSKMQLVSLEQKEEPVLHPKKEVSLKHIIKLDSAPSYTPTIRASL